VPTDPYAIQEQLLPGQKLPTHPTSYGSQVVWCVDSNNAVMTQMAEGLHGKRLAAGEGAKSAIVRGLSPDWPALPETGDNIRIYVAAHGAMVTGAGPVHVKIVVRSPVATEGNTKTASDFFQTLRAFVQKSPAREVRRISLVMCASAGIHGQIPVTQSFARQLADLCEDLTTDITGRMGEVDVKRTVFPVATINGAYHPLPNPLYTVMTDTGPASLVNAKKLVDGRHNFRTYIFAPGRQPTLKTGYAE
jgi:hypothetical protein